MRKEEFLAQLRKGLSGLPREDIEERINFYSEMIDDRIEEGLSEEEAVSEAGSVEGIAVQIAADFPAKKKTKRRLKAWEIVLLALGSPVWLSLLISAVAVVLSLYISLWAVIVSLWAVFASAIACSAAGIAVGVGLICVGYVSSGFALIGGGLVCAGLAIFLFYGCHLATKGTVLLAKAIFLWIKNLFIKKEDA